MSMGTEIETEGGMSLATGIGVIIGLAILFFVCGIVCYCLCSLIFKERDGTDPTKPVSAFSWTAKHYYDPSPSVLSPPPAIFQPSAYSFKLHNGSHPHQFPHAVINPAVLQFPPGHAETNLLEDRTAYSSHFQPRSGNNCRNKIIKGRKLSISSSRVSPTNVPLVHSDEIEMVQKGNGHGQWHP